MLLSRDKIGTQVGQIFGHPKSQAQSGFRQVGQKRDKFRTFKHQINGVGQVFPHPRGAEICPTHWQPLFKCDALDFKNFFVGRN